MQQFFANQAIAMAFKMSKESYLIAMNEENAVDQQHYKQKMDVAMGLVSIPMPPLQNDNEQQV